MASPKSCKVRPSTDLVLNVRVPPSGMASLALNTKIQQCLLDLISIGQDRRKIRLEHGAQFDDLGKSLVDQGDQSFD
jgi:hypothetical protein